MAQAMKMKVKCPECEERIDLDVNEFDQGDPVECPECSAELIVFIKKGRLAVKTPKADYYDSELEELYEED